MNNILKLFAIVLITFITGCTGCNRVKPNHEGVLMENYGRNGRNDFKTVTGSQGMLWFGSELYQVPMWEQKADPTAVAITARDAGNFTVDPTYTYQAIRGKGVDIIFNYKHVGVGDVDVMMDNIEGQILNPIVVNAYREEARNFTTDSLMNNLNKFENAVQMRLVREFERKFFVPNDITSGLKPPQSMAEAIERRNNAIQRAEQVRNELEVSKMNLEKARIDAEANKVRTTGLSKENLTEQWIDAIRNTQNKVIITDGKIPILLTP